MFSDLVPVPAAPDTYMLMHSTGRCRSMPAMTVVFSVMFISVIAAIYYTSHHYAPAARIEELPDNETAVTTRSKNYCHVSTTNSPTQDIPAICHQPKTKSDGRPEACQVGRASKKGAQSLVIKEETKLDQAASIWPFTIL